MGSYKEIKDDGTAVTGVLRYLHKEMFRNL